MVGAQGTPVSGPNESGNESGAVLTLSLKQAVQVALAKDGSTRVRLAQELVRQARAQSAQQRSSLLPNLDGSATLQNRTTNLAAIGIGFRELPGGFSFPQFVGPFGTFDARVRVNQTLLDVSAVRRFQASRIAIGEAQLNDAGVQDQVAGAVASNYMAALHADARLEAARADVQLAEAIVRLANDQKKAGTGTGIEVTRASVQLANERQQMIVAENDRRRTYLEVLRTIGLPLGTQVSFSQQLQSAPFQTLPLEQALVSALNTRSDFQAQQRREEKMRLQVSAVKLERLPSLHGFADYGSLGSSIGNSLPTRTIGASLVLPIFDGGRREGREAELRSQLEQERVKTEDLRQEISLELRVALDDLQSAETQVKVSEEGLQLSTAELEQAQRRYRSGITSSLEVTDAQARMARARENRVAALFRFNQAKVELGMAMGTIQKMIESDELAH